MKPFLVLVDSHVHIYDCYNIKRFFYSALNNFQNASKKLGSEKFVGILFLTETKNENYFHKLKENQFEKELTELNLRNLRHDEFNSIIYENNENNYLIIISGKQIITSEKLEVLAIGTTELIDYGNSLKESVEKIKSFGALPVLPWGVGKWVGKREKMIEDFIDNNTDKRYFLGDNGGRPVFWPAPELFKTAEKRGIKILRGSDPLPLNFQEEKVGKFGFYSEVNLNLNCPAKEIIDLLLNLKNNPVNFGNLEASIKFF